MSRDGKGSGKTGADWRGLPDFRKYDQFVEGNPDGWWDLGGPIGGLHVLNRARVAYFREKFGGFQDKRVLDVGCGGGILSESLATEGAHVVGIDPSSSSVEVARRHAAAALRCHRPLASSSWGLHSRASRVAARRSGSLRRRAWRRPGPVRSPARPRAPLAWRGSRREADRRAVGPARGGTNSTRLPGRNPPPC